MAQVEIDAHGRLGAPWLYFEELVHRIGNEYAVAISSASLQAARTRDPETRAALKMMTERLRALSHAHRILQPPLGEGLVDLSEHLATLCAALSSARLEEHAISLSLDFAERLPISSGRCWRVGLIVAELVTNASRHAFAFSPGTIRVTLVSSGDEIACRVGDDGSCTSKLGSGRGTRLVDALAAELDGTIDRNLSPAGSTVTVTFPLRDTPRTAWRPDLLAVEDLAS